MRENWQDVVDNNWKLPPYEPCNETVDELLATIKCSTSREIAVGQSDKIFVLRMMATSGSIWRFVFKNKSGEWNLIAAIANDETEEHRVDLLDDDYGEIFHPKLERIIKLATTETPLE